jgi:hypothetical protein
VPAAQPRLNERRPWKDHVSLFSRLVAQEKKLNQEALLKRQQEEENTKTAERNSVLLSFSEMFPATWLAVREGEPCFTNQGSALLVAWGSTSTNLPTVGYHASGSDRPNIVVFSGCRVELRLSRFDYGYSEKEDVWTARRLLHFVWSEVRQKFPLLENHELFDIARLGLQKEGQAMGDRILAKIEVEIAEKTREIAALEALDMTLPSPLEAILIAAKE